MVLDDRHALAHHCRTSLVAAQVSVETDDTVAIYRVVPLHNGAGRALPSYKGAAVDIPLEVLAGRGGGAVFHHGAFAYRAVAVQPQSLANKRFNLNLLFVVASAVVIDAVRHGGGHIHVFDGVGGCRRRQRQVVGTLPVDARDVAVAGVRLVDECHRHALAHADYLAAVGQHRVGRYGHATGRGVVDELHITPLRAGVAVGGHYRDDDHAPLVVAPVHGTVVAGGGVRHIAGNLPYIFRHRGSACVGVGCIGDRGMLAGYHQVRVFVEILVF